jgi:hypothetical protein
MGVRFFDHRHAKSRRDEHRRSVVERRLRSRLERAGSAVSKAPELSKASKYRRNAAACGIFAANALSPADRELLLLIQRSWLGLAYNENWLDGLPPIPGANSNSLAVPRLPNSLHAFSRHLLMAQPPARPKLKLFDLNLKVLASAWKIAGLISRHLGTLRTDAEKFPAATCPWLGLLGNDCDDSHFVGVLR